MGVLPESRSGAALTIVAGAMALVIGLFVILTAIASYRSVTVERRWAGTIGTREEFLERYPPLEANAAALELERLTAPLGIDTAPRHGNDRPHPASGSGISKELKRALGEWRDAQLERTQRRIDPVPAAVADFLDEQSEQLRAIRDHLIRNETPRWEMHMERNQEAPIPNLLGHIDLQKLLVTDALAHLRAGDRSTAAQDLEAGWRLMQSLWDSPILISQLIAIADARMIAAALRQFEDPPPVWLDRLAEHDFRQAFTAAMRYEGWAWTQFDAFDDVSGSPDLAGGLMMSVSRPYWRYCLADASDAWRERLDNLDRVPGICDYDLSAYGADLDIDLPRWNMIGRIAVPNLAGAVQRVGRLEFELELTARLLELDAAFDATSDWPEVLPGGDRSKACPKDRWSYHVNSDGSAELALDRLPAWPKQKGYKQVSKFRVAATD